MESKEFVKYYFFVTFIFRIANDSILRILQTLSKF